MRLCDSSFRLSSPIALSVGLCALGLTVLLNTVAAAEPPEDGKTQRPKNVLLLLTDDQSAHLSCLGTRGIATPNIDELASGGVLFRRAYATCASCSPSRSSILTGTYPHSNGHWRNTVTPTMTDPDKEYGRESSILDHVGVHEDLPTIIEILNEHSYVTGITEKFHLSPPWKFPFHHRKSITPHPASHKKAAQEFFAACADKPFFFLANIGNTHRPFKPHTVPIDTPPADPNEIEVPPDLADTPAMRADLAEYFTTVQCADAVVGAIIEALKDSGHYEDTLIICTSDQGYAYHRAKATPYDAGIRVPLVFIGPGVREDVITRELFSHVDLTPTILDYLGIAIPASVQGRSIRPFLDGKSASTGHKLVFFEHNAHGPAPQSLYPSRSVTDGRMHYIHNLMPQRRFTPPADMVEAKFWGNHAFQATLDAKDEFPIQHGLLERTYHRPPEELYDLHTDPGEIHNLIGDDRFARVRDSLRKAVDDWMKETNDPGDPTKIVRRTDARTK